MKVAVFGLGEAGALYARDLAASGIDVHAYDPAGVPTPPGVTRHNFPASAVEAADAVFAFTSAHDATTALIQAIEVIPRDAIYADFSTAAAGLKEELARHADLAGFDFVDVAMMSPVPGKGFRTPALASGTGAQRFVENFAPVGLPIEFAGGIAGLAATRKLLRSIVIKGFAALLIESMRAANAAGLAEETWSNLVGQFAVADESFLRRIVEGTGTHSLRRLHEMEATVDMLHELGVAPVMTSGTVESLRQINAGETLPSLPA